MSVTKPTGLTSMPITQTAVTEQGAAAPVEKPADVTVFKKIFEQLENTLKNYSKSKITIEISRFKRFTKDQNKSLVNKKINDINKCSSEIWNAKKEIKSLLKEGKKPNADRALILSRINAKLVIINQNRNKINNLKTELNTNAYSKLLPKNMNEKIENINNLVTKLQDSTNALKVVDKTGKANPVRPIPPPPRPGIILPPPPSIPEHLIRTQTTGPRLHQTSFPKDIKRAPLPPELDVSKLPQRRVTAPTSTSAATKTAAPAKVDPLQMALQEWVKVSKDTVSQTRIFAAAMSVPREPAQRVAQQKGAAQTGVALFKKHGLKDLWDKYQDLTNKQEEFNVKLGEALARPTPKERLEALAEVLNQSDALFVVYLDYMKEYSRQGKNVGAFLKDPEVQNLNIAVVKQKGAKGETWTPEMFLIKPVQAVPRYPLLIKSLIEFSPSMSDKLQVPQNKISNMIMQANQQLKAEATQVEGSKVKAKKRSITK